MGEPVSDEATVWRSPSGDTTVTTKKWLSSGLCCVRKFSELHAASAALGSRQAWWCGYVILPIGHKWEDGELCEDEAEVHGGITFHRSKSDGVMIGFDVNHYGDNHLGRSADEAFCVAQTERLAAQVAAVKT